MMKILYKMLFRKKRAIQNWVKREDYQDIKSLIPLNQLNIDAVLHDKVYKPNMGLGFIADVE
jgi:hypothetical protein